MAAEVVRAGKGDIVDYRPNKPLQQTAAAMLVVRRFRSQHAEGVV
jgi:hypothetical protein